MQTVWTFLVYFGYCLRIGFVLPPPRTPFACGPEGCSTVSGLRLQNTVSVSQLGSTVWWSPISD